MNDNAMDSSTVSLRKVKFEVLGYFGFGFHEPIQIIGFIQELKTYSKNGDLKKPCGFHCIQMCRKIHNQGLDWKSPPPPK